MKYHIITYGCQMNKSDSERIIEILERIKYQPAQKIEEADLIIIVACSVRQKAIDRIYGKLKKLQILKIQNPKLKIIITGCLLRYDKEKIVQNFSHVVDKVISIQKIIQLPKILNQKIKFKQKSIKSYLDIYPKCSSKIEAYVPIMTGCNNYCAYCVVPYTRDKEISRSTDSILKEIKNLIKDGYKKITLLGQNVNSYSSIIKDIKKIKKINFVRLLELINNLSGNFWFTFITNHPKDMSEELIKKLPYLNKLCHYIHLPLQSGDNQILKKMNRNYSIKHYLSLIKKIRQSLPDVNISTDIIVGFPGETEKQFLNTKKLMEKVKFDMAYIACYSPRPQTLAYKMKDNLSSEEKKRRERILTEVLKKTALENNQKYLNKIVKVLVEEKIKNNKLETSTYFGETKTLKKVKIETNQNILGKFVLVKITQASPWGLKGKLIRNNFTK